MRWILVEIRTADPKLLFVRIDPLPQEFTPGASLRACLTLHAHKISCEPMAIATAAAPTMVGAVRGSLVAADELLPVIIAESAGYARRKPGVVHRAKRIVQLPSEFPIHASDHVVLQRHTGLLRGFRILPPEVLGNVFRQSFDDGPRLALVLDLHFDLLVHFDGVDLWRPPVQRPEVLVDADVRLGARIESFGAYGRRVLHGISRTRRRGQRGWRGWLRHRRRVGQGSVAAPRIGDYRASCVLGFVSLRIRRAQRRNCYWYRRGLRHRRRVGQSGAAAGDISNGDTMLALCCCSGCVDVFGEGGRRCCLNWCSGALDAERTEASEPGPYPTGESDRSA